MPEADSLPRRRSWPSARAWRAAWQPGVAGRPPGLVRASGLPRLQACKAQLRPRGPLPLRAWPGIPSRPGSPKGDRYLNGWDSGSSVSWLCCSPPSSYSNSWRRPGVCRVGGI